MNAYVMDMTELPALRTTLAKAGFEIDELDCGGILDQNSFFLAALHSLPMGDADLCSDQAWCFPSGWDAFNDFHWQGLTEKKDKCVAIVLTNASRLAADKSLLHHDIMQCFDQVADAIRTEDKFNSTPAISLQIYLLNE